MNRRLVVGLSLLLLVSLAAAPALAAMVLCPSGCSCLLPAEAAKAGYADFCGGKQQVCSADTKGNAKYCYNQTTPAVPQLIVTGFHVVTTTTAATPAPVACPAGCSCFTLEDGKKKGLPLCGGKKILCGYTANKQPEYCHGTPVTVPPPVAGAVIPAVPVTTTLPVVQGAVMRVITTETPAYQRVAAAQRCTIAGRINGFVHNRSSLRVRLTPEGGEPVDVYTFPEEGPVDAVIRPLIYSAIVPCSGAVYDIEPVEVPDPDICPWTGTFTPARLTGVRTNGSNIEGQDFTFVRPADTQFPQAEISFTPPEPGADEGVRVTFRGRDDSGIAMMTATGNATLKEGGYRFFTLDELSPSPDTVRKSGDLPGWSDTEYFGSYFTRFDFSLRVCDAAGNEDWEEKTVWAGSCSNGIQDRDEKGADCGGRFCDPCPACIPVRIGNPDSDHAIDVVFVMDSDYGDDREGFLADVQNQIENGYFGNAKLGENRSKFNFYVHGGTGDYEEVCDHWTLPAGFDRDCSFADARVILHRTDERDCSSGGSGTISASADDLEVVVHESGHGIFGMKDEYCCDGGYRELETMPNVFTSEANCRAYAASIGVPQGHCFNYCPVTKCWPGTATGRAACTAYRTSRGRESTNFCDCTAYATANGMDPALCTATDPDSCPPYWKEYWDMNTVATADLTVSSPTWCNYRGTGVTTCCGSGWWKLDIDPFNRNNNGNCVMTTGAEWGDACMLRVDDKMGRI